MKLSIVKTSSSRGKNVDNINKVDTPQFIIGTQGRKQVMVTANSALLKDSRAEAYIYNAVIIGVDPENKETAVIYILPGIKAGNDENTTLLLNMNKSGNIRSKPWVEELMANFDIEKNTEYAYFHATKLEQDETDLAVVELAEKLNAVPVGYSLSWDNTHVPESKFKNTNENTVEEDTEPNTVVEEVV